MVDKTLPRKHVEEFGTQHPRKHQVGVLTLIVGVLTCVYVILVFGGWKCSPNQAAWLDEKHQ